MFSLHPGHKHTLSAWDLSPLYLVPFFFPPLSSPLTGDWAIPYPHLRGHSILAFLASPHNLPGVAHFGLPSQNSRRSDLTGWQSYHSGLTEPWRPGWMVMMSGLWPNGNDWPCAQTGWLWGWLVLDLDFFTWGRHSWNHYSFISLLPLRPPRPWRATSTGQWVSNLMILLFW